MITKNLPFEKIVYDNTRNLTWDLRTSSSEIWPVVQESDSYKYVTSELKFICSQKE